MDSGGWASIGFRDYGTGKIIRVRVRVMLGLPVEVGPNNDCCEECKYVCTQEICGQMNIMKIKSNSQDKVNRYPLTREYINKSLNQYNPGRP